MARIGFMVSEEMFENVDDGRTTTDGRRRPAYTRSSPMNRRLTGVSKSNFPVAKFNLLVAESKFGLTEEKLPPNFYC